MPTEVLSDKERQVLRLAEFDAEQTADELGRRLGIKSPTVSYALRKLQEQGVIQRRAFINSYALGYLEIAVYFSLLDQTRREEVLSAILEYPEIGHLSVLLGDYTYLAVLLCRHIREVPDHFNRLFAGKGDLFADKLIAPRLAIYQFPRKYLAKSVVSDACVSLEDRGNTIELDSLDQRILEHIVKAGYVGVRELARGVAAPSSTVERRLQRLRDQDVIKGFYYAVDTNRLGFERYRVLVAKKGICTNTKERIIAFCQQHPNCTGLVCSLGSWDFELVVETRTSQEVITLIEQLHATCGVRIAWTKVLRQVSSYKCARLPYGRSVLDREPSQ